MGLHKQGWSYVTSYEPDYFKKIRFKSIEGPRTNGTIVNVGDLDDLITRTSSRRESMRSCTEIDLDKLGFRKILGKGQITRSISVRVKSCSKEARRKIEESGGKIILTKADIKT